MGDNLGCRKNMNILQIETIEKMGGAMSAIEEGWQQREIHNSAFKHLKEVENNSRKIIGVNHGVMEENIQHKPMTINPELEKSQHMKLKTWRMQRDNDVALASLDEITEACNSDSNLFPLVIDSLRKGCTLGEIMTAMKEEFGTWMAPSGF